MGDSKTARRGYLTLHRNPGGRFPLSTLNSKRMWMVLYREGPSGRPRVEMYRSEDSVAGHQPLRMIDLETVRSIKPVERKKGFLVELAEETMMLQCTSKADMEDWVRDMNRLRGSRVDLASGQNITDFPTGHEIYEVVPDDETFRVNLRRSDALQFSGPCYLEILTDFDRSLFHIALLTKDEPSRLIVKWQIDHIRQYGSNSTAFKFQSGGKSPTGVGWFIVETESGAALRIHKAVDYWAKYIVDQIRSQPRGEMQRAGSVPTPQPAPHPPLSASLGAEQPTGNYTPLTIATLDGQGVYQPVAAPGPQGGRQPVTPAKNISKGGRGEEGGVYQALGQKDAPSNYAAVSPSHRGQGGGAAARGSPTPPTRDPMYMGLVLETRQPNQHGTYAVPERK